MRVVLPVSVVIATRDRAHLLPEVLDSIASGDAVPAEIVIVDQSTGPAAASPLPDRHSSAVRWIHTTGAGVSRGRNHGARLARHGILVFTDDDVLVRRDWLSTLVGAITDSADNEVVTGRVLPGVAEVPGSFVSASACRTAPARYRGRIGRDVLAGGNMAIRADYFNRLGRFDTDLGAGSRFPAAEDNDLGLRVLETGGTVRFVPDAVVVHRAWRPADAYIPLRYAYGRGKGGFYMKHLSLRDRYIAVRLMRDVLTRFGRAARYCTAPRRALGELAYAWGVVSGALTWVVTMQWSATSRLEFNTPRAWRSQ
jgi:GT2 family glycosyltransferase